MRFNDIYSKDNGLLRGVAMGKRVTNPVVMVFMPLIYFIAVNILTAFAMMPAGAIFGMLMVSKSGGSLLPQDVSMEISSMMTDPNNQWFTLIITTFMTIIFVALWLAFVEDRDFKYLGFTRENNSGSRSWSSTKDSAGAVFKVRNTKAGFSRSNTGAGFSKGKPLVKYLRGFLLGIGIFSAGAVLIILFGDVEVYSSLFSISIGLFILMIIGWIIQGASEEILARGFIMSGISYKWGIKWGVTISSIGFACLHLLNSGISVLSFINLILYAVFASQYALYEESLWGVCAFHSAWNWTQGNLFGILVSGEETGGGSIITTVYNSDNIINGGEFGAEGGLAITLVLLISIAVIGYLQYKKSRRAAQ